ncbi:hypothetical protein ACX80E_11205 [Arthrobacter sp. TMN-49]
MKRPGQPLTRAVEVAALNAMALMCLLLSGCTFVSHYQPEPAALQDAVDCSTATGMIANPSAPGAQLKGRVPDGFVPVDAVTCTREFPAHPPSATTAPNPVITEEHLSGDYTALLAALAQSSDSGGARSCADYAEILPELWLVNAEAAAIHVQWPLDSCEKSKPGTATALAALTVTSTTTMPAKEPAP